MASTRILSLAGLLALSGLFAGTGYGADDPTPEGVLNERGLKRSGKFFIVASEEPVRQAIYNMRPVMVEMEAKFNEWAAILQNEYEYQALTDYRIQVQGHLADVDTQIGQMPSRTPQDRLALSQARAYRQSVDQELRNTNSQIEFRRKRFVPVRVKDKAENDFKEARKRFLEVASNTRPLYDKVLQEYATLSEDNTVSNALKAYNQMTKANFKLGPSDKLKKDVGDVKKYEQAYSPETAPRPTKRVYKGLQSSTVSLRPQPVLQAWQYFKSMMTIEARLLVTHQPTRTAA
jgi:hypothetical protein